MDLNTLNEILKLPKSANFSLDILLNNGTVRTGTQPILNQQKKALSCISDNKPLHLTFDRIQELKINKLNQKFEIVPYKNGVLVYWDEVQSEQLNYSLFLAEESILNPSNVKALKGGVSFENAHSPFFVPNLDLKKVYYVKLAYKIHNQISFSDEYRFQYETDFNDLKRIKKLSFNHWKIQKIGAQEVNSKAAYEIKEHHLALINNSSENHNVIVLSKRSFQGGSFIFRFKSESCRSSALQFELLSNPSDKNSVSNYLFEFSPDCHLTVSWGGTKTIRVKTPGNVLDGREHTFSLDLNSKSSLNSLELAIFLDRSLLWTITKKAQENSFQAAFSLKNWDSPGLKVENTVDQISILGFEHQKKRDSEKTFTSQVKTEKVVISQPWVSSVSAELNPISISNGLEEFRSLKSSNLVIPGLEISNQEIIHHEPPKLEEDLQALWIKFDFQQGSNELIYTQTFIFALLENFKKFLNGLDDQISGIVLDCHQILFSSQIECNRFIDRLHEVTRQSIFENLNFKLEIPLVCNSQNRWNLESLAKKKRFVQRLTQIVVRPNSPVTFQTKSPIISFSAYESGLRQIWKYFSDPKFISVVLPSYASSITKSGFIENSPSKIIAQSQGFKSSKRDEKSGELTWLEGQKRFYLIDQKARDAKRSFLEKIGVQNIHLAYLGGNL